MDHIKKLFHFCINNNTTSKLPHLSAMNHIKKAAEVPGKAAEKVFGIAELAEMILLGVDDVTTLVPARRVNKMFNEVIARDMQHSKQKYWLACDKEHRPMRWIDNVDGSMTFFPQAHPEEIELNPWAARGCIPKLSLQYTNALLKDNPYLCHTSVVMEIDATVLLNGCGEPWQDMEIIRLKEEKRDLDLAVIVKHPGANWQSDEIYDLLATGRSFEIRLSELESLKDRTMKGMIERIFQYWRVAQQCQVATEN